MTTALKTKWTICSSISINILLLPMVTHLDFLKKYSQCWVRVCCLFVFLLTQALSLSLGTDIYIESFHKEWKNDYKRLERVHSYIQWCVCLGLDRVFLVSGQSEIRKSVSSHFGQFVACCMLWGVGCDCKLSSFLWTNVCFYSQKNSNRYHINFPMSWSKWKHHSKTYYKTLVLILSIMREFFSNNLKILLWLLNMWYLLKYLIEVTVFCRVSWHHIGTVVSLDVEWILCWFSLGFSAIKRLFPLREPGVNYMASELTKKEIEVRVNQKTSV